MHTIKLCKQCNQKQWIESYFSKERPFRRIDQKYCLCGFIVEVVPTLDLEKIISSDPLPGFDRDSVENRLRSTGILYQC